MYEELNRFIKLIEESNGIWDKEKLIDIVLSCFSLIKDRKVFYNNSFSVRFSYSRDWSFSNTVLSLSNLRKYDDKPFIVCLVTPQKNILYIANTTFLKKISHSSKELRCDNIKWSFNWSDIIKNYEWYENSPKNFGFLFDIHKEIWFEENLVRLVEETNKITPIGKKFEVKDSSTIYEAPQRAINFISSNNFNELKKDLDDKVEKYKNEILIAAFIENIKIRWTIIEYLIAWEDELLKKELISALHKKEMINVKCGNGLWDYTKIFENYYTETDIKTKIMILNSNPKAYNIDKLLEFLSKEKSIFMFYFIWVEPNKILSQSLVSIFQKDIIKNTIIQHHRCSRATRWETQLNGKVIEELILKQDNSIDINQSKLFLKQLIEK